MSVSKYFLYKSIEERKGELYTIHESNEHESRRLLF